MVVVMVEVEVVQASCLHKQKVEAVADKEQDAVAELMLKKSLAPTQTTAKNWFQVRMNKPKRKSIVLVATFINIIQVNAPMWQEVA